MDQRNPERHRCSLLSVNIGTGVDLRSLLISLLMCNHRDANRGD